MSELTAGVGDGRGTTRRQILTTLGGAGALALAGCSGGDGGDGSGDSGGESGSSGSGGSDDTVTLGLALPETGNALNEGEQLKAGYELAVTHLNEGAGLASGGTIQDSLGGGILGEDAEAVVADTQSTASGAEAAAAALVEDRGADVLLGGGSSAETISLMGSASAHSTVYLSGFAPTPAVGGGDCSPYGFTEMCNTKMIGQALGPALRDEFGSEKLFGQVYPNTDIGKSLFGGVQEGVSNTANWRQIGAEPARVGTTDFEDPINRVLELGPDVVILNFLGLDGADALREACDIVPDDVGIAVSLYSGAMARNAGDALEGILGTIHWEVSLNNTVTSTFADAWADAAGEGDASTPSDLHHLAYMQTMQYAAAAERAGSLTADDVVSELEDYTYDIGLGEETMRGCDHRAVRPVPVVKGLPGSSRSDGKYFQTVTVANNVGYSCDQQPASKCSF